jgi:hypothetical protein
MPSSSLSILFVLTMSACQHHQVAIENGAAFLFETVADCQSSRQVGPGILASTPPAGVVAEIPAGTVLDVRSEYVNKDSLCYEVEDTGKKGFILGWKGRIRIVK